MGEKIWLLSYDPTHDHVTITLSLEEMGQFLSERFPHITYSIVETL